jgi:hypothetical protein
MHTYVLFGTFVDNSGNGEFRISAVESVPRPAAYRCLVLHSARMSAVLALYADCGGVHSRTSKTAQSRYACSMQPKYMKAAISAVWVCALCAVALFVHLTFSAWVLLAAFAVLPPLVVMRYWRDPVQTTSESIQEVLR